jgi:hypothetical protein
VNYALKTGMEDVLFISCLTLIFFGYPLIYVESLNKMIPLISFELYQIK